MTDLPPLRDVIARHGLNARHSLGQHFLLDANLTARIAREAGTLTGRHVIEIGPGPGGLTRALLASDAVDVTAVELDRRAVAAMHELAEQTGGRLRVIEADALRIDATTLTPAPRQIIANLPYNVASPLLVGWLRQAAAFERFTLMFQQEVAQRLVASPGSGSYGRLSVLAQWRTQTRIAFSVPPRAFIPAPKVTSAVVHLVPMTPLSAATPARLAALTAAAFGQRRKMLRASLKGLPGALDAMIAEGISPEARAETVPVAAFAAAAERLSQ